MSDEFDPLRRLKPDTVRSDDPSDPAVFSRHKAQLMSMIDERAATGDSAGRRTPAMYPRLAYLDEVAAVEYLTRVFGFRERRGGPEGPGSHRPGGGAVVRVRPRGWGGGGSRQRRRPTP